DEEYLALEEHYFSKDRKSARKERKFVSNKDRSQFKKTDKDQRKKLKEGMQVEDLSLSCGRVQAIIPDEVIVDCEGTLFNCTLKGVLKKQNNRIKNLLAVGDIVWFEEKKSYTGTIVKIAERTS